MQSIYRGETVGGGCIMVLGGYCWSKVRLGEGSWAQGERDWAGGGHECLTSRSARTAALATKRTWPACKRVLGVRIRLQRCRALMKRTGGFCRLPGARLWRGCQGCGRGMPRGGQKAWGATSTPATAAPWSPGCHSVLQGG